MTPTREGEAGGRRLCETCGGNGVVNLRKAGRIVGVSVCFACDGHCWADCGPVRTILAQPEEPNPYPFLSPEEAQRWSL